MGKRASPQAGLFSGSIILSALERLAGGIYKKLRSGMFGAVFCNYDSVCKSGGGSLAAQTLESAEPAERAVKRFFLRQFEESVLLIGSKERIRRLKGRSVKNIGIFFFSLGLYSLIITLIRMFALGSVDVGVFNIAVSIGISAAASPMLFAGGSISSALAESRMGSFLVFDFCGIRREGFVVTESARDSNTVAFILGMAAGIVSYFIPVLYITAALFALLAAYTVMTVPEFGIVCIIIALPFLPTMLMAALVIYVLFCYLFKLIRGKRTFAIEPLDVCVLLFMVVVLFGGVVSVAPGATLKPALLMVCFMLGYFLTVNLIRTEKWMSRCVGAVITALFVTCAIGVYENFSGNLLDTWQDKKMFSEISGRVVSTFENPNVLAEYIIMAFPFVLAVLLMTRKIKTVLGMLSVFAVCGLCLIYTWSRGAWLGLLFGAVVFLLIYSKKTMIFMLFGVGAIPFLPFIMPASIVNRFLSIGNTADTSTAYRLNIWKGSLAMIKDILLGGIGVGNGAFSAVYPKYTLMGIESAPHSHNLYLQIIIETGLFGIAVFAALLIAFAMQNFTLYKHNCYGCGNKIKLYSAAGLSGMCAVLVQGMTDYIWYNYRVFFMFWLVLGLTAAVCRSAGKIGQREGTEIL